MWRACLRFGVCAALAGKVGGLTAQGKRVAIWEGGAKTLSILAASPAALISNIACIIDSDPHKQGRYVPNTSILVVGPDAGSEFNPDVVFVLALSYREEIAAAVRERMPTCSLILTLDDRGEIIKL